MHAHNKLLVYLWQNKKIFAFTNLNGFILLVKVENSCMVMSYVLTYRRLTFRTGLREDSSTHEYPVKASSPKTSHGRLNGIMNQQDRLHLAILLFMKMIKTPVQGKTSITHSPVICLITFAVRLEHSPLYLEVVM